METPAPSGQRKVSITALLRDGPLGAQLRAAHLYTNDTFTSNFCVAQLYSRRIVLTVDARVGILLI